MGVVMFLPSIALNVVTGIDIFVCIGLMGIISLIYTMMGGIEAVIWTDVMQVIVLLGGALLALVLIIVQIDGGFSAIVDTAAENNKFNVFDFNLSLKQPTVWVMLLGGIFANITTYGTDQTMVQRYLTTKSAKRGQSKCFDKCLFDHSGYIYFLFCGNCFVRILQNPSF
jgi:solute:Na+ symporter, SSS family